MAVVAFFALGIILCTCSGVTHWRVHEEVIRAVDETVITARETCTDCNKDDTNTVTVYDREFSTIIKSHHINHKSQSVHVFQNVCTVVAACISVFVY